MSRSTTITVVFEQAKIAYEALQATRDFTVSDPHTIEEIYLIRLSVGKVLRSLDTLQKELNIIDDAFNHRERL